MAIKRYQSNADNTISNAYQGNMTIRATGSNMGATDILETFAIQGQVSSSTNGLESELARILKMFLSFLFTSGGGSFGSGLGGSRIAIPLSFAIVVVTKKKISKRNAMSAIDPELTSGGCLFLFLGII